MRAIRDFLEMELSKKFKMTTSCHVFKVDSLEVDRNVMNANFCIN